MFLNKKSLSILELFLNLNKYNFSELERLLKIKKTSILIKVEEINSFLHEKNIKGILNNNEIFYIDKKEILKIKNLLSLTSLTPIERADYILLKLFFNNKIILNNVSIELDITRRTLNYDLEKIKEYLKKYNLELKSLPSKGIFLIGNETDIRFLFANYLTKYFVEKNSCHSLFTNLINNFFPKKEIDLAKTIVLNILDKMDISLPSEDFFKIVSIILIHTFRKINFPYLATEYKKAEFSLKNNKVINFLIYHGLDELSMFELDMITKLLLSVGIERNTLSIENEVNLLLENLELKLNIDIPQEQEFLINISNIIRIGKFKIELNFSDHKELYKLDKKHKKYYTEIHNIIKEIIPKFFLEDIFYLTILIKNTLDRNLLENKSLKNIVIIDNSFNHMYGRMLLKYIKGNYHVNILKILDHYQLNNFLENGNDIDFILTLNDINVIKTDIPIITLDFKYILNNVYELEKHGILKK